MTHTSTDGQHGEDPDEDSGAVQGLRSLRGKHRGPASLTTTEVSKDSTNEDLSLLSTRWPWGH